MATEIQILENVKKYYGQVLKTNGDLKTSSCCSTETLPAHLRDIVSLIHPHVQEKFYGCGSPIPDELQGRTVLDLGCGSGRDCYLLSKLVGEDGQVVGVDMTDEQLDVAVQYMDYHREKFGYVHSNVRFLKGYIEDLGSIGIRSESVDVVVSNCVLNLSPDKRAVFSEIFRVLKPGGELYFSDVFAGRRVPSEFAHDPFLLGECLGGALYIEDFRRLLREMGCLDYRVVSKRRLNLSNPEIEKKVGMIDFYSMTIRAFKLELEDLCEDYGQVATYQGTIPEFPHTFVLDDHHIFHTGMPKLVCGNTASMLTKTRYAGHFKVIGDRSVHYGPFDCRPQESPSTENNLCGGGACC